MKKKFILLPLLVFLFIGTSQTFSASNDPGKLKEPSAATSNLKVVAYYAQWSVCDMPPQKLDYTAFSHLIYFWGEPISTPPYFNLTAGSEDSTTFETGTPGWCLNPLDNGTNGKTHQKILRDSCTAHGIKLILCVGGEWGNRSTMFSQMIADTSPGGKQDQFIQAALGFTKRHGYDGIDINWEFPDNSATGRANFDRFCYKVRARLDTWSPKGQFTMAMPTWFWYTHWNKTGPVVNISTVNNCFDFVDLEMYGMENTAKVSFYSPIYSNPAVSSETWDYRGPNEWLDAGVQASKIVTLIPFECLKMSAGSSTIGSSASGPQWVGLRDIPSNVLSSPLWDDISKSSYGWANGSEYLFETQQSLTEKIKYVQAKGIGGVGIWELWRGWLPNAAAGQQDPLLKALKNAVGGVVITPPPPPNTPRIKGALFFDKNSNGVQDQNELGMPGWTIHLQGTQSLTALTDSSGSYSFNNLPFGSYTVSENLQTTWTQTSPPSQGVFSFLLNSDTADVTANFGDYASSVVPVFITKGWDIISMAVYTADPRVMSIYPTAISNAVSFNNGYMVQDSLVPGGGYWTRFGFTHTYYSSGPLITQDTVDVDGSWDMIGSIGVPIVSSVITTLPPDIVTSNVYGFNRVFSVADSILPGKGYWVKTSQPGKIILSSQNIVPSASAKLSSFNLNQLNSITFTDNAEDEQTLYFGSEGINQKILARYALPPPFQDMYDVRFSSTTGGDNGSLINLVANFPAQTHDLPIAMRSVEYPLKIRWKINIPTVRSQLEFSQSEKYILTGSGEMSISGNSLSEKERSFRQVHLKLSPVDSRTLEPGLPVSVSLSQNYPNPFNPTTSIKFELPLDSHVKLDVYNVLGERVVSLIDKEIRAGSYAFPFDGAQLSSGVYIYKLQVVDVAGGIITKIHHMALVK